MRQTDLDILLHEGEGSIKAFLAQGLALFSWS